MRDMTQTLRLACAIAVAGALLAGCGLVCGAENGKRAVVDMDMQGAAERADGMFYATVGEIKPEVE
ncbi:hypothetical protein GCM10010284_07290 [Streptomyces rubiginosohelvolus]|uniref:Lipoprotein n=1 Tax=Streptomyces rubiginosohelvolus TaxID=67362 RepID=A0ABQ3BFL2_9ACTN|nr:hypothetical protein GCM10010284_07290 [Streptomyces rubiginosohelvolus]GGZ40633.1 hypothetical protein GCM10010328_13770 [Streptomyces pluricolorescens]